MVFGLCQTDLAPPPLPPHLAVQELGKYLLPNGHFRHCTQRSSQQWVSSSWPHTCHQSRQWFENVTGSGRGGCALYVRREQSSCILFCIRALPSYPLSSSLPLLAACASPVIPYQVRQDLGSSPSTPSYTSRPPILLPFCDSFSPSLGKKFI